MKFKNKIGWFFVLIVVVCGVLFMDHTFSLRRLANNLGSFSSSEYSYNDDYDYYSDESYESDDSDGLGLGAALFIEAFVTIHMCAFVLVPLSKIFGKRNHKIVFWILFIIRVFVLIIGDLISPSVMVMTDFFAVFIGAFLVVPLCTAISGVNFGHKSEIFMSSPEEILKVKKDVSDKVLAKLGLGDKETVKRGLVQHYEDIINYCNKKDYSNLVKLCSPGVYTGYKTEIELYSKVDETKLIEDFSCDSAFIVSASRYEDSELYIDLKISYSCYEYVVDPFNKVIRGSKTKRKKYIKVLYFSKKLAGNFVTTCPNCNASINEDNVEFCSYCGTALNFDIGDWILKKETILSEK